MICYHSYMINYSIRNQSGEYHIVRDLKELKKKKKMEIIHVLFYLNCYL